MSSHWYNDVIEFHEAFDCHTRERPEVPPPSVVDLRLELIREEYMELVQALMAGNLPEIADGAIDLIYVVLGTLASHGIDPAPIWEAVHAANMKKAGGTVRNDGKRLKPDGWRAPDIAGLIAAQQEA